MFSESVIPDFMSHTTVKDLSIIRGIKSFYVSKQKYVGWAAILGWLCPLYEASRFVAERCFILNLLSMPFQEQFTLSVKECTLYVMFRDWKIMERWRRGSRLLLPSHAW